jgi:hypothetical protein
MASTDTQVISVVGGARGLVTWLCKGTYKTAIQILSFYLGTVH